MTDNPRPFAEQAYHLCVKFGHHDEQAWFCTNCRMLEWRLTPLTMDPHFQAILADADVKHTVY